MTQDTARRPRYVGGISQSIDVYAAGTRLGSITKVRDQWVAVCAHPDLAGPVPSQQRSRLARPPSCGRRVHESGDPVAAKSSLILHHADHHDLDEEE